MNESQIHLALTHVPVILSLTGMVVLVISLFTKNNTLTKTSFYILLLAGLFAVPVFATGEGTEEIVEKMPGVSENIIERHESVATIAMIVISVAAVFSLAGLIFIKQLNFARVIKTMVLIAAMASVVFMVQTAHLGGQIRHTEIRSGFTVQNENQQRSDPTQETIQQGDDD